MKYNKNTTLFNIVESQGLTITYGDILLLQLTGRKELAAVTQVLGRNNGVEYQLVVIPDFNRWNDNNIKGMTQTEITTQISSVSKARLLTREEKQEFKNLLKDFTNSLSINGK
jgi:hypothetical protein